MIWLCKHCRTPVSEFTFRHSGICVECFLKVTHGIHAPSRYSVLVFGKIRNVDDNTPYWLCCGSTVYPHGAETCHEAEMGFQQHIRFGTAKEHSDWQKAQCNKTK